MKGKDGLIGVLGALASVVIGVAAFGYADPLSGAVFGAVGGGVAVAINKGGVAWRQR